MPANTTTVPFADAHLSLSGPLTQQLVDAVLEACRRAEKSPGNDILVLRLTGAPGVWPGDVGVHLVSRWEKALCRLQRLDRITIGVCGGRQGQAALEILLATDLRILATDTELRLGGSPNGHWPGMALHRLVHQAGPAAARRLLLTTELVAEDLQSMGVADEVAVNVDEAVAASTARIAGLKGTEVAVRRRLLLDAPTASYEEALGSHLAACDRALRRR